jgi:hypothetical protein
LSGVKHQHVELDNWSQIGADLDSSSTPNTTPPHQVRKIYACFHHQDFCTTQNFSSKNSTIKFNTEIESLTYGEVSI